VATTSPTARNAIVRQRAPEQRPRRPLRGGEEQRREEQRQDQVGLEREGVGQAGRDRHRHP
jgi:hypothetical protein